MTAAREYEEMNWKRLALAEGIGTGLLLAAVVGSGIMGVQLAAGNDGLALLANTAATGAALFALISTFGDVSGAHFNPAVTCYAAVVGRLPWNMVLPYVTAQLAGAVVGVWTAHAMFAEPILSISPHARAGLALGLSECVATLGLLLVIEGTGRKRPDQTPLAVACYIVAAYWFTASTSFANPAATLARALTHTFAGIRPTDVPGFILGQALGALGAVALRHHLWAPSAQHTGSPKRDSRTDQ